MLNNPTQWLGQIFGNLFAQALIDGCGPVHRLLTELVFTPTWPQLRAHQGMLTAVQHFFVIVSDAALVLVLVWLGLRYIAQTEVGASLLLRQILSRLALAVVLINFSWPLLRLPIEFSDAFTQSLLAMPLPGQTNPNLVASLFGGLTALQDLVLDLAILVMLALLAFTYAVRLAILCLLAGVAPMLGLATLLPETQRYASSWGGLFVTALMMQPIQVLVLKIGTAIGLQGGFSVLNLAASLASMYVALKVPGALNSGIWFGRRAQHGLRFLSSLPIRQSIGRIYW